MSDSKDTTSMSEALDIASSRVNQLAAMIQIFANDESRRDWDINTEAWYVEACSLMAEQAKSAVSDMYQHV